MSRKIIADFNLTMLKITSGLWKKLPICWLDFRAGWVQSSALGHIEHAMKKIHGGILCLFEVMSILFGLSLPVLDDLCGPTASREAQNTTPVFFWTCVAIPVLFGVFMLILGYIRCYRAANKSPKSPK
jgi:hypothetical protein